jgi:hypothetical protein
VNFRKIIVSQFEECFRETERNLPVFGFKILNFMFSFYGNRKFYRRRLKLTIDVVRKRPKLRSANYLFYDKLRDPYDRPYEYFYVS